MGQETRNTLLHLSLVSGIGPATAEKIVQKLSLQELEQIYRFARRDLAYILQLSETLVDKIFTGLRDSKLLETELSLLEKYKINWLTVHDSEYPILLKQTHLPPTILYYQGSPLSTHEKTVAMVGSRASDNYGQQVVQKLVPELCTAGYSLVSGGALGIDTHVHREVCAAGGKTVVVLGSGLLKAYPSSNKSLFESIRQNNGTIVSSFSLETGARPENFPARNRIISGLSRSCVVIQAGIPSGALITAQFALDQGREVGAVPGPITSLLSIGCHKLLSEGAAVITQAADIRALCGEAITLPQKLSVLKKVPEQDAPQVVSGQADIFQLETDKKSEDPVKKNILKRAQKPISIDELRAHLNLDQESLEAILWNLELEGMVKQDFIGLWQAI